MAGEATDPEPEPPRGELGQLLARVQGAGRHAESVSLEAILDSLGQRSFAPFLLVAGLVTLAPLIGDIPGVPTLMAALVVLAAVQLLAGREHIWLPSWLLSRRVSRARFVAVVRWMQRPAHWIDRLLKPRLTWLTRPPAHLPVAVTCLLIALAMPPMEVVPFTANGAGLALTLFALALLAHDGLMALLGYFLTFGTLALVVIGLA
ncbi:exopolysaccharide biosynthesis protein [Halomonas saccharevitans]|uniref:Exopolysaccharide biosynthesis protein n=1 Tax=Halomonas saccharevitans TaxID=416872 RepID=A0ABU3NE17_9GAMM|nr:exopolysaccharide biosynthesis protein [Halomonas saccharevitans]MDT8879429.1 exopolysaccharide biosynthesis protein [Halomonas saccharevitans]